MTFYTQTYYSFESTDLVPDETTHVSLQPKVVTLSTATVYNSEIMAKVVAADKSRGVGAPSNKDEFWDWLNS